jgi:hypothetical protein
LLIFLKFRSDSVKRINKKNIKLTNVKKAPQMLNFSGDASAYATMNNRLDVPLYNSFFNNTPSVTKFTIGSFNYNPVTQTNLLAQKTKGRFLVLERNQGECILLFGIGRTNSRKSSNPRKKPKIQSKTKAAYKPKQLDKYLQYKIGSSQSRPSSKNSKDNRGKMGALVTTSHKRNSSMRKEISKRPTSPAPRYLAADIARFHKLSQKLKASKGHSSLGFTTPEALYPNLTTQSFIQEALRKDPRESKSPVWVPKSKPQHMP